ncbi:FkbM family methyltransferase [Floridanema flaviceps]
MDGNNLNMKNFDGLAINSYQNMTQISYAQHDEDLEIMKLFKFKASGYYVEVGANDGKTNSNTALLEEKGWKGLLIEANPDLIDSCVESRPNSIVVNYAVVAPDNVGNVDFYKVVGGPGSLDGLSTTVGSENFTEMINRYGGEVQKISVPATTLDELLKRYNSPLEFELLSIDVEGAEMEVLRGFSIAHFKPKIVIVEDNSHGENTTVANYLRQYGYIRVHRTGVNDWYVCPQDADYFRVKRVILNLRLLKWWLKRHLV